MDHEEAIRLLRERGYEIGVSYISHEGTNFIPVNGVAMVPSDVVAVAEGRRTVEQIAAVAARSNLGLKILDYLKRDLPIELRTDKGIASILHVDPKDVLDAAMLLEREGLLTVRRIEGKEAYFVRER